MRAPNRPRTISRPIVVAASALASPRRATSGLDSSRVAMVLAVCERRGNVRLAQHDTYVATVGGVTLREPAADLATALAVASAASDRPLPPRMIALGEVGLAGDVRPVSAVAQRLAEAARLGFTSALVPPGVVQAPDGMTVTTVDNLGVAVTRAFNRAR